MCILLRKLTACSLPRFATCSRDRRVFKRLDRNGDQKVCLEDLMGEFVFLQMPYTRKEASMILWEVDDDHDGAVDWEEFRTTYNRCAHVRAG
jgi:Ca2+-binding EF-hand superfamily protein